MANLPQPKQFVLEDFQGQKSWIDRLLYPLNTFMRGVYSALNKNLTFSENFKAEIRVITIKNTDLPYTFSHKLSGRALTVFPVKAYWDTARNSGSPIHLTSGLNIESEDNGKGQVVISRINGLPNNDNFYTIKLLILTE